LQLGCTGLAAGQKTGSTICETATSTLQLDQTGLGADSHCLIQRKPPVFGLFQGNSSKFRFGQPSRAGSAFSFRGRVHDFRMRDDKGALVFHFRDQPNYGLIMNLGINYHLIHDDLAVICIVRLGVFQI
jgi:hypothetical protein